MPYWRVLLGMATLLVAGLLWQPYSVVERPSRFDGVARRYLAAALRGDRVALKDLSATSGAVEWGLNAERDHRDALTEWTRFGARSASFQRGDTTDVLFDAPTKACPVLLTFVDRPRPRVVGARARCYIRRGWPADPTVIDVSR